MIYKMIIFAAVFFISGCGGRAPEISDIKEDLSRSSFGIFRWNNSYCIEKTSAGSRRLIIQLGLSESVDVDLPNEVQMSIIHLNARDLPSFECNPRYWMTQWHSVYYPREDGYSAVHLGDLGNGLIYFDSDLSIDVAIQMAEAKTGLGKLPDPWSKPIEIEAMAPEQK